MENKKVYLDTNIVADILDATRKGHSLSIKLLEYFALEDYEIFIREDMITTLYYISKNKNETLEFFKNLVLLDWNISSFGKNVLKNAIDLSLEKSIDLEDTLQCLCAKENGCKVLITHDKIFYDCGLSIYTIEEFLKVKIK